MIANARGHHPRFHLRRRDNQTEAFSLGFLAQPLEVSKPSGIFQILATFLVFLAPLHAIAHLDNAVPLPAVY